MTPGSKIKFTGSFSVLMVVVILLSTVGVSVGKAQDAYPPDLKPQLSSDGLTLYDAVKPLVIVADSNPAMQDLKFPADAELAATLADPEAANATFSITYVAAGGTDRWGEPCLTFPAAAKTAFNKAAEIWSNTIQSTVPITIRACWANLGSSSILGYSGGQPMHRNFTGAPKTNTWYQGALANSLRGTDLDAGNSDMNITYNTNFTWYYGTDGNTPAGQYDLVTVAAHEIAHGLNFSGTASYSGGNGSWGYSGYPNIYDTFMESSGGTKVTAYTSPSVALGNLYTSNNLWFDGAFSKAANGGTRVKMYAPSTWKSGSSYSHLDYSTFAGTSNSMMVYAVSSGASQHNPGNVTKGIFRDMGWTLVSAAAPTVPTPNSPSGTITDRTPTFNWSKITGATNYQFEVRKGTTLVYTKTVTSAACGATTCSNTPTTLLAYAAHNWRVRAKVGGVWKAWSAYKNFTVTAPTVIPTPVAPSGNITDRTPTFRWSKIAGATNYQFEVRKGTALVYTRTVTSTACGATTCSNTPTTSLAYAAHKWRVRAKVGGLWKAWSAYKNFSVQSSAGSFNSTFTSNSAGWTPVNGTWIVGGGTYQTPGVSDSFTSSRRTTNYSIFTYEVRLRRSGCSGCSYGIMFNGSPLPVGLGARWNQGYGFYINDSDQYSIWRYDYGSASGLVTWTTYSPITTDYNTLKVTYNKTSKYVQFFINGVRIAYGYYSSYQSGQVGLTMFNDATLGNRLYVDWATLSLTAPSAMEAGDGILVTDDGAGVNLGVLDDAGFGIVSP